MRSGQSRHLLPSDLLSEPVRRPPPIHPVMADGDIKTSWVISFGPFRVTRARRLVERDGEVVRLGSRAFDILAYLLERAGQVVSHRALLEAVWPGTHVGEGNLRFQMAVLRKALGSAEANYIINVPGRGYCFTAPLSKQDEVSYSPPRPGNVVVQAASLAAPQASEDAANIFPYPASRLDKAGRTVSAVSLDGEKKGVADNICIKLDDLASAIELVTSQIKASGIDKLSDLLEERWLLAALTSSQMLRAAKGFSVPSFGIRDMPGDLLWP
jgi:DNA-binding winged helix-turn-helix (wHTH) protein